MLLNIPKVLRMRWPTLLIQFAGKATQTFMRFIMQVASKPGMTPRARAACRHIRTDVLYSRSRVGPWVVEVLRGSANSVPAVIHVHELVTVRIIPGNGVFVPRRKRGLWRCHFRGRLATRGLGHRLNSGLSLASSRRFGGVRLGCHWRGCRNLLQNRLFLSERCNFDATGLKRNYNRSACSDASDILMASRNAPVSIGALCAIRFAHRDAARNKASSISGGICLNFLIFFHGIFFNSSLTNCLYFA